MKKFWTILILIILFSAEIFAAPIVKSKHGALYIENATYAELGKIFAEHNFVEFGQSNLKIPRIYVKNLPTDWQKIKQSDEKNQMFIGIMLPLIMKINEELDLEHTQLLNLLAKAENNEPLSVKEQEFVEKKAVEYDVFTRNKEKNSRYKILLRELVKKVDELPPAFLIAVAGVYSDWGNSRLATEANSLYREEIWYSDEGIKPQGVENADFTYRKFSSLEEGLRSYMRKINSNITYQFIWTAREQSRKIGRKVLGEQIIVAMAYEGTLKNIAGMLDFNLSYYKLNKTDINPSLEDIK